MKNIYQEVASKSLIKKALAVFTLMLGLYLQSTAQMTFGGQVRTRTELRKGQGALQPESASPSFFTSQRTRLNWGYSTYRLKTGIVVQDVRVWGQDGSSINRNTADVNDGTMLHEAWADISLIDTISKIDAFSLKIGRQELVYDDERLLGNLNWLQQARRHDAAVLKFKEGDWEAHLGVAYNQTAEYQKNNAYNGLPPAGSFPARASTNGLPQQYKTMQYLHLKRNTYFGYASMLLLRDDFEVFAPNGQGVPVSTESLRSRVTVAGNVSAKIARKHDIYGTFAYQGGNDPRSDKALSSYMFSVYSSFMLSRKLWVGPGVDYLSGTDHTNKDGYTSFDPLYGTPHKFWGFMDYYYVANGFGKGGLANYYIKARYKALDKLTLTADFHQFMSATKVADGLNAGADLDSNLGNEIDITANYALTNQIRFELGYSAYMATNSTKQLNLAGNVTQANVDGLQSTGQWGYLMVIITPNFLQN